MITNLILPDDWETVQDDMWVIMESDNSSITNFKYVVDVYDGLGNQLIRSKVYPNPTNNKGYFNIGSILRNLPQYNQFKVSTLIDNTYNYGSPYVGDLICKYDYEVQVGEDYSGTTTTNLSGDTRFATNFRFDVFNRFQESYLNDYINKFISTRPTTIKIGYNENFFIPIFNENSFKIRFTFPTSMYDGDPYDATSLPAYPTSYTLPVETGVAQLNLKLENLFSLMGDDLIGCELIDGKYDVIIFDEDSTWSHTLNFVLDCCPKYEVVLLHFLNRFNGYETARFSLVNRLSMETERKSFQKNDYQFNTDSVTYFNNENVFNESKINYGSKTNWKYKLTMDFPSDAEYEWLSQLMTSPQIYAEIQGNFYPVTITNTNYEYSKYIFNQLKQLEVEIELNQTRFGFRR